MHPSQEVNTIDDDTWVVANVVTADEIDYELDVLINLGNPAAQALIMQEHRAPSICSSGSISDDSGTADGLMQASATRLAHQYEQTLFRNAVHDLLADPTTQAALYRAMHNSTAVNALLHHTGAAALLPPLGFAASHEALMAAAEDEDGAQHKVRACGCCCWCAAVCSCYAHRTHRPLGNHPSTQASNPLMDMLHVVGKNLQLLGHAVEHSLHEAGMAVMQFFSNLGKQVREAAANEEMRARGGLMAVAVGVFVMALLRRRGGF